MHDKRLICLLTLLLLPTLALASVPPQEFFNSHPGTSAWLFGAILAAFLGAVGIIAKMVNNNVERAIRHSEQTNEAQWNEIRNLKADHHVTDKRLSILENEHHHYCGGRRMYDPPVRTHYEVPKDQ